MSNNTCKRREEERKGKKRGGSGVETKKEMPEEYNGITS
jgi:hypothetical protein